MNIIITPAAGQPVTLGDESLAGESIDDFLAGATSPVQTEELLRATHVANFERQNIKWELSWKTTRLHADMGTMLAFLIDHPESALTAGALAITITAPNTVRIFPDAVIVHCQAVTVIGVSTIHAYSAVAGAPA